MTKSSAELAATWPPTGRTRLNAAVAAFFHAANVNSFSDVCDALADAAEADDLPFLDAVDRAQNLATACGQEAVEAIMSEAFRRCRVHKRPSPEPLRRAAESTVEALMYSLRERGTEALSESACRDRLAVLSSNQIRNVIARLIALRSRYPNVADDLLFKLGGQL